MSAGIRWRRAEETRLESIAQAEDLRQLVSLIEDVSEETEDNLTVPGRLVGLDEKLRTFHFEPESGEDIRGRVSETYNFLPAIDVPTSATITVTKNTKVKYSTGEEKVDWTLTERPNST